MAIYVTQMKKTEKDIHIEACMFTQNVLKKFGVDGKKNLFIEDIVFIL